MTIAFRTHNIKVRNKQQTFGIFGQEWQSIGLGALNVDNLNPNSAQCNASHINEPRHEKACAQCCLKRGEPTSICVCTVWSEPSIISLKTAKWYTTFGQHIFLQRVSFCVYRNCTKTNTIQHKKYRNSDGLNTFQIFHLYWTFQHFGCLRTSCRYPRRKTLQTKTLD